MYIYTYIYIHIKYTYAHIYIYIYIHINHNHNNIHINYKDFVNVPFRGKGSLSVAMAGRPRWTDGDLPGFPESVRQKRWMHILGKSMGKTSTNDRKTPYSTREYLWFPANLPSDPLKIHCFETPFRYNNSDIYMVSNVRRPKLRRSS